MHRDRNPKRTAEVCWALRGRAFHLRHTVLTVMNIGGSGYLSMQANARKAKMAKESASASASASEAGSGSESEVRRLVRALVVTSARAR